MFRRVAVGLVASAATILTGVPAHAGVRVPAGPVQSNRVHPHTATARAAHPLPSHRHREVAKPAATAAANNSKRDGGSAATVVPVAAGHPARGSAVRSTVANPATPYVSTAAPARAPPARQ